MRSCELNQMLISNLPQLHQKYIDEVSWQEGDDTGSHTVFGDVLTPYLVECILQNNKDEKITIFNFLENMLSLEDEYVEEVIALSVIGSIAYLFYNNSCSEVFLGKRSKLLLNNFL